MQKYREYDGGRRNWDARDLGRNLASWSCTYSQDGAQKRANARKHALLS